MKKMIGLFSLVAMLTLTFSVGASAEIPPDNMTIVCDIGHDYAVEFVPTEKAFDVFVNVTVEAVNCKGEGGLIDVDVSNVAGDALLDYCSKNTLTENTAYSYQGPDIGFVDTGTPKNYKLN